MKILFDPSDRRGNRGAVAGLILVAALFCLPLFRHPDYQTREIDWNQLVSIHLLTKNILLEEHQLPFWTPQLGGGYPIWAYPETDLLNPFYLLSLLSPLWLAVKIRVWIYYLIGGTGMFFLGRKAFGFNLIGAFLAAFFFTCQSYFPYQVATGNLYLGSYYYLPWIFLCLIKSPEGKKYLLGATLLLTHLFLGATGLWMVCLLLFLFLWCLLQAIFERERRLLYLKYLLLIISLTALLAAARLIPLLELLGRTNRVFPSYGEAARGSVSLSGFFRSLLSPGPFLPGGEGLSRTELFSDSTIYLGILPLFFSLWAFIFSWKKYRSLFFLLIIFSLLTMGGGSPLDIYHWLWRLPVFHSLHFPNKYFAFFLPFILALTGGEFFRLLFRRKRVLVVLTLAAAGLAAIHLFLNNISYHQNIFALSPPASSTPSEFRQVLPFWDVLPARPDNPALRKVPLYRPGLLNHPYGDFRRLRMDRGGGREDYLVFFHRYEAAQYRLLKDNLGDLYWYGWLYLNGPVSPQYFLKLGWVEANRKEESVLFHPEELMFYPNPAWPGRAYLSSSGKEALVKLFSSNQIILQVKTDAPDILVINQNYYPGWKARGAGKIFDCQGLLGVKLKKAGNYMVELSFRPRYFYLGLFLSGGTLLLLLIWGLKRKVEKR